MIRPPTTVAGFAIAALLIFTAPAAGQNLLISFEEETLSAHVKGTPLRTVTEKIENETGVWFKAGESLLQEPVSVVFDGLPFEDGLERILSKVSYSLVFNDDDEIVGVFLFRSVDPKQKQSIRAQVRRRTRVSPVPTSRRRTIPTRRPRPFRN